MRPLGNAYAVKRLFRRPHFVIVLTGRGEWRALSGGGNRQRSRFRACRVGLRGESQRVRRPARAALRPHPRPRLAIDRVAADADDIAQDVCCTLVEKIGCFRGEAKFSTWLRANHFQCLPRFRRKRRSFWAFSEKLAVLVGSAKRPTAATLRRNLDAKRDLQAQACLERHRRPGRRPAAHPRRGGRRPRSGGSDHLLAHARGAPPALPSGRPTPSPNFFPILKGFPCEATSQDQASNLPANSREVFHGVRTPILGLAVGALMLASCAQQACGRHAERRRKRVADRD